MSDVESEDLEDQGPSLGVRSVKNLTIFVCTSCTVSIAFICYHSRRMKEIGMKVGRDTERAWPTYPMVTSTMVTMPTGEDMERYVCTPTKVYHIYNDFIFKF